jgi:ribokinase
VSSSPRICVVGHVEWVTHALGTFPVVGGIAMLADPIDEPGGGGGIAAVQVAKLGADCHFFTAVADDDTGRRCVERLTALGVTVHAARRVGARHSHALSVVQPGSVERTILVDDAPLDARADDPLDWSLLDNADACYVTSLDVEVMRRVCAARRLVVAGRRAHVLEQAAVQANVVVASADDLDDRRSHSLSIRPDVLVETAGGEGGRFRGKDGVWKHYLPTALPGPPVDACGCGDSFIAGLTTGLGQGLAIEEALELGAICGAACLTGRGGLSGQHVASSTTANSPISANA